MVLRKARKSRCQTCIRRKVKCDGVKPHCGRCVRTGFQCAGYVTERVFIDEGARFRNHDTSPAAPDPRDPQGRAVSRVQTIPPRRQQQVNRSIRFLRPEDDMVFLAYFLSRFSNPTAKTHPVPLDVLAQAFTMDASQTQQSAVRALATVYFGKTRYDRRVYDKGMRLYSKAIGELVSVLKVPAQAAERDTLVGALCLCLFENIVLSEPVAWLRHYKGVADLLESGGPRRIQGEFDRDIFRYCRFISILSSGHLRQHCFLSGSAWKSPQWALGGAPPTSVDLLHDIFADVPGLLHDFDNLREADIASASEDYRSLCHRVDSTLRRLQDWAQRLSQHQQPEPPEPTILHDTEFPQRPADAVALATCYAIILCLMTLCETLGLPLFTEGEPLLLPGLRSLSNESYSKTGKALAVEICHLATSAFRGELSLPIGFSLIFPLQIASCHIASATPEAIRLEGIMDCVVAESHGIEIGRRRMWGDIGPEQGAAELTGKNFLKSSSRGS